MAFGQNPAAPAAAAPGVANFQRGAPPPARPPVAAGASMWSGVQSAADRDPKLGVGHYRLRVVSNEITIKPDHTKKKTFKATFDVVEAMPGSTDKAGDARVHLETISGDSAQYGLERSKAYMVAAAGYDGDATYDAFDPKGEFLSAIVGVANSYSAQFPANIVGRLVDVRVSQGNPVLDKVTKAPTGDYWRVCSWTPVPETEQVQPMPVFA